MIEFLLGDCLDLLPSMPDASVDMILSDLPYGTTYAPWDSIIPLGRLWPELLRVVKPKGAIVLTASQPFTSILVSSQISNFRCEWIWNKVNGANFANSKRQPLKIHESVLVFATGQPTYNPQMTQGKPNHRQGKNAKPNSSETRLISERVADDLSGRKYPVSIQTFPKHSSQLRLHSTQKPTPLFEYLIQTYSNPGEIVLDVAAGSGTTGEAAKNTGRKSLLFDVNPECIAIMRKRFSEKDS